MSQNHKNPLSEQQLLELNEAMQFLKMQELKELCVLYGLSDKGYKAELIQRIVTFIGTGEKLVSRTMPSCSKAHKEQKYRLASDTLILFGAYKNDLKTRDFFKTLIGNHFHFTAYGIDWLNERWYAGNPPTYAEFAQFWQQEYSNRKLEKKAPKKEWALINFVQKFIKENPYADRNEVITAWKHERLSNMEKVKELLKLH